MEQNGNKNVETAEATQVSHEETEEAARKTDYRQPDRCCYPGFRTLENRMPLPRL